MEKLPISNTRSASLFAMDGIPHFFEALPLALQHVVAMIVGCVTPAIIVAGAAGLSQPDRVVLIQASLIAAAIGTILQLYPLGKRTGLHFGAGLPVIFGVSFAYVPTMQSLAGEYGIAAILGAEIFGGICAILVGLSIHRIRKFFPPLVAGTVVFTIGLSLYPIAINYMAGGVGTPTYGSWQNWVVALFTLVVVIFFTHFASGLLRLASILVGIVAGYLLALAMGMVQFDNVMNAGYFEMPRILHFGLEFDPAACIAISILFVINSIQAIGDFSATTSRRHEPPTHVRRTPRSHLRLRSYQHLGLRSGLFADSLIQPERRHRHDDKSHQPGNLGPGSHHHPHRRHRPQIFRPFNDDSLRRSRRSHHPGLCLHCHDRHQTSPV